MQVASLVVHLANRDALLLFMLRNCGVCSTNSQTLDSKSALPTTIFPHPHQHREVISLTKNKRVNLNVNLSNWAHFEWSGERPSAPRGLPGTSPRLTAGCRAHSCPFKLFPLSSFSPKNTLIWIFYLLGPVSGTNERFESRGGIAESCIESSKKTSFPVHLRAFIPV